MTKLAGEEPLENMFKEPVKQKEFLKEEIKCEEFSLILAQWKASTARKIGHPATVAALGSQKYLTQVGVSGKESIVGKTSIIPPSVPTNPEDPENLSVQSVVSPTGEQSGLPEGKGKASVFWQAMKGKPPLTTSVVFKETAQTIEIFDRKQEIFSPKQRGKRGG